LSDAVTWQILKDHMKKAGDVAFADVERDHNGRSLGYGIVEFKHYDDMRYAIKNLNDTSLEGKYITVKEVQYLSLSVSFCLSVCCGLCTILFPIAGCIGY